MSVHEGHQTDVRGVDIQESVRNIEKEKFPGVAEIIGYQRHDDTDMFVKLQQSILRKGVVTRFGKHPIAPNLDLLTPCPELYDGILNVFRIQHGIKVVVIGIDVLLANGNVRVQVEQVSVSSSAVDDERYLPKERELQTGQGYGERYSGIKHMLIHNEHLIPEIPVTGFEKTGIA